MTQEDPSDRFLSENLILISETGERNYYQDPTQKILVASWKPGSADHYNLESFQLNALRFAQLIEEKKPRSIMVDCRYLGFEISDQDQRWYINQTRKLWDKSSIKRMAFVFRANLSVQMAMEGLKDVAQEEGVKSIEYRIFENLIEAFGWIKA